MAMSMKAKKESNTLIYLRTTVVILKVFIKLKSCPIWQVIIKAFLDCVSTAVFLKYLGQGVAVLFYKHWPAATTAIPVPKETANSVAVSVQAQ